MYCSLKSRQKMCCFLAENVLFLLYMKEIIYILSVLLKYSKEKML